MALTREMPPGGTALCRGGTAAAPRPGQTLKERGADSLRYLVRSNRRVRLDGLLAAHASVYVGTVLDIGSRRRGRFHREPTYRAWFLADIIEDLRPDVVLDVSVLPLRSCSVDSIKATELFEHVARPEAGLRECHRVLRGGGVMVLSVPFLFRIHADPFDFQRWTIMKWRQILDECGFEIVVEEITGTFFTVIGDMLKVLLRSLPKPLAAPLVASLFPVITLTARLDDTPMVRSSHLLSNFHSGYFFIVRKGTL